MPRAILLRRLSSCSRYNRAASASRPRAWAMLHVREMTRGRAQRRTCLGPECRGRISSGWQSRSRADALVARHLRAMTVYCLHINHAITRSLPRPTAVSAPRAPPRPSPWQPCPPGHYRGTSGLSAYQYGHDVAHSICAWRAGEPCILLCVVMLTGTILPL